MSAVAMSAPVVGVGRMAHVSPVTLPDQRLGHPEELATAVAFLASATVSAEELVSAPTRRSHWTALNGAHVEEPAPTILRPDSFTTTVVSSVASE
jgi:NAD(P)-dependent dehydrogenase (short-subunit alcohol dehydrogenase family)